MEQPKIVAPRRRETPLGHDGGPPSGPGGAPPTARVSPVVWWTFARACGIDLNYKKYSSFRLNSVNQEMMRIWIAPTLAIFLCSCSTYSGVEEFAAYRDAFQQTRTASNAILDRLAVAEREVWRFCINTLETGGTNCVPFERGRTPFQPDHATFISTAGDPPGTAAFRRGVLAVNAYTEALSALASGQTAGAVAAQLGEVVGLAAAAASAVVPAAATGSALAPLTKAIGNVNDNVAAFTPPATQALGFVTRAEFRSQLAENGDKMMLALENMRNASGLFFRVFQAQALVKQPSGTAGAKATNDKIEENRLLLANWVVMLDASRAALAAAQAAAKDESAAGMSALLAVSRSLTEAAQETRRVLSGQETP